VNRIGYSIVFIFSVLLILYLPVLFESLFEQPIYTLYLENGEPWQVSAEEAVLYENNRIKLDKNVKIINLQSNNFVKQITTEFIEINLQDKTLASDQSVKITGIEYEIQSLGIFGDLSTQQYELKEHVQTTFNPVP